MERSMCTEATSFIDLSKPYRMESTASVSISFDTTTRISRGGSVERDRNLDEESISSRLRTQLDALASAFVRTVLRPAVRPPERR